LKRSTYITLLILSIVGLLDSLYLYYTKITSTPIACYQGSTGCEVVNSSRYATIYGIPNGLIGFLGYSAIIILLIIVKIKPESMTNIRYLLFGFSFVGFLYSFFLTFVSIFILKAECPFCILSAIMMTSIFIISIFELKKIYQ
jgi:uncharacterized membrane protein